MSPQSPSRTARASAAMLVTAGLVAGGAVAAGSVLAGAGPAAAQDATGCDVVDATLDWGFKESFRAYIDGTIANGEWTTSGDADYATPEFSWAHGEGWYLPREERGAVEFSGSVRFTGHGGVLDTTIANPRIEFDGGAGTLFLDVAGATMEGDAVDVGDAAFADIQDLATATDPAEAADPTQATDPTEADPADAGQVVLEGSTLLTEDGSAAFPNYAPGDALDPITVTMPLDEHCADLAAEYAAAETPRLVGIVVGAATLAAALVVLALTLVRRRSTGDGP